MLIASGVALSLAVIAGLFFVVDQRHRADVGRLADGYEARSSISSQTLTFLVPTGRVQANLEMDHTASPEESEDDRPDLKAPHGGRILEVKWSLSGSERYNATNNVLKVMGDAPVRLSFRTGGTTTVLTERIEDTAGDYDSDEEGAAFAVDSAAEDLELVATFAGRSQSVRVWDGHRTMGDFAGLYREISPGRVRTNDTFSSGREKDGTGFDWLVTSELGVAQRVPYVAALGWAPRGQEWVVVRSASASALETRFTWNGPGYSDRVEYRAGDPTGTLTVNGKAPVRKLGEQPPVARREAVTYLPGVLAFAVPYGDALQIRMSYSLPLTQREPETASPDAPKTTVIRADARATQGPVADPTPGEGA